MSVNPAAGNSGVYSLNNVKLDGLDVQTMIQLVLSEKSQLFNQRLETMVKDMQATNRKISDMTKMSADLTAVKNGFGSGAKNDTAINDGTNGVKDYTKNVTSNDVSAAKDKTTADIARNGTNATMKEKADLAQRMIDAGVWDESKGKSFVDGSMKYGDIDTAITQLKQKTDSLSADANLQQIALNRLIGLKDNTDNMLASLVKKFGDTMAQIISKVG